MQCFVPNSGSGRGSPSSSWILLYFRFWFPVRNRPSFVMIVCASAIITHHLWIYAKANTRWWWCRKLSGVLTFRLKGVCLGKEAGLWKIQASNKTGYQQPVQCAIQGSWGQGESELVSGSEHSRQNCQWHFSSNGSWNLIYFSPALFLSFSSGRVVGWVTGYYPKGKKLYPETVH